MADTNQDICFIFQVSTKQNVRSSTNSYKTLAKKIREFHKKGKLGFRFESISNANSDLSSVLTTIEAVCHYNCFLKYSDSKLNLFNEPSKKQKYTEDENVDYTFEQSTDESKERFNLFYYWCGKKDVDANLVPARTGKYKATILTTKSNHMKDLTAQWIEMATKLNHEAALRLLSSGDVASNELYYQYKCYDSIRYQCSKFTKSEPDKSSNMRNTECQQIALKKVII